MVYVKLQWLENQPAHSTGVTWGVPWKQGELDRNQSVSLYDSLGEKVGVQTWPMAYWPDGSVKWTGHGAVIDRGSNEYQLKPGENKSPDNTLQLRDMEKSIQVDTGRISCEINKEGNVFIQRLLVDEMEIGSAGKLIAIKEERQETDQGKIMKQERLEGEIKSVEIEQTGPLRAVIKIEGVHENKNNQQLFPFIVRFYFYANLPDIRIVHTFIYDGDSQTVFIKGLGMEFKGAFSGDAWNRTVQLAGDEGMYTEPGQLLLTRRYRNAGNLFAKQISGETVDMSGKKDLKEHVNENAKWNDFKIIQDSANHYKIVKRTEKDCSWVESTHGKRAQGALYAGGTNGGSAVGIKNFWEKHPSSLEVRDLTENESTINVWLWSPDYDSMDFRHYSKKTHVLSAYEGFDEMRATPEGIANTSELFLTCFSSPPTSQELVNLATDCQDRPLLVCEPEYYYGSKALGIWSLPNYDNPFTNFMESQLESAFQFYKKEIEQRSWYGYWNYGDIMHTYDPVRHQWRYDLGGFAWQNTELVPNIWLWYTFLRTGRSDVFKMAEAMTRHTSEVDRYHIGEYAGLGSRHNVVHWGCGCKEARVSMAGLHKYYYFLTADERTRDLLTEVRDADFATVELDPMRANFPKDNYPTHSRVGPDWAAFCSNWLSEWERTEDNKYRDKLTIGMNDLKKLPFKLLSGPVFGYDPSTSHLHHMGDGNSGGYHMMIAFGAPQVWMEMAELLEDEEWKEMIAEFGEFYSLTDEEKKQNSNGVLHDQLFHWPMFAAGLVAYAANKKQSSHLAHKAWNLLLDKEFSHTPLPIEENEVISWKTLKEIPWITTNTISQWCLNTITCLELIGHMLPDQHMQESVTIQKCDNNQ